MSGINKAFFGQNNALKIQYNEESNEVYLHLGKVQDKKWSWYRAKLKDTELGNIGLVLDNKLNSLSFFHKFNKNPQQIFVNRSEDGKYIFFKIGSISKSLNESEVFVLRVLIERIIVKISSRQIPFNQEKKEVTA